MSNVHLHPSDETLMAYVDGELDAEVAAAVERAILADPTLAGGLVEFVRSRRLARLALGSLPEHMSAGLCTAVSDTAARSPRAGATPKSEVASWGWSGLLQWVRAFGPACAAAATIAVTAGGFGYVTGTSSFASGRTALSRMDDPAVFGALTSTPSGERHDIGGGVVRPIATYRLKDGGICRDYVLTAMGTRAEGLACSHDGNWRAVVALGAPDENSYAPAGGEDLIDSFLQNANAGDPLSEDEEKSALSHRP